VGYAGVATSTEFRAFPLRDPNGLIEKSLKGIESVVKPVSALLTAAGPKMDVFYETRLRRERV